MVFGNKYNKEDYYVMLGRTNSVERIKFQLNK